MKRWTIAIMRIRIFFCSLKYTSTVRLALLLPILLFLFRSPSTPRRHAPAQIRPHPHPKLNESLVKGSKPQLEARAFNEGLRK
jgi:hypothetical protein